MANVRVDGANQTVIVGDGSAADSLVKFDGMLKIIILDLMIHPMI